MNVILAKKFWIIIIKNAIILLKRYGNYSSTNQQSKQNLQWRVANAAKKNKTLWQHLHFLKQYISGVTITTKFFQPVYQLNQY